MFESWHFPNSWNGNNRFIAYLDKKDFESVKDLQKNLLGSKFIQSNSIFVSIREIEKTIENEGFLMVLTRSQSVAYHVCIAKLFLALVT